MKTITVLVPTYNEEKNIINLYNRTKQVFTDKLSNYDCKLFFVDNCSTDNTEVIIRELCEKDRNVSACFNAKNFGFSRSQFNGLKEAKGDAVIMMYADMQDPPEIIPHFVMEWEKGAKIVCGIKNNSKENPLKYFCRHIFYAFIKKISDVEHISQFDGFGLYDRSFLDILKNIDDNLPYLRGIVAEYGSDIKKVMYTQEKRMIGKSHFHFLQLYDLAMLGITSYSKTILHLCTILGFFASICSCCVGLYALIEKFLHWDSFPLGTSAIQVGVFLLGSLHLLFIGLVGEYVANINVRTMKHPLVVVRERINYE